VWDSDTDGYPHALRVTLVALADDGKTTAVARRVISLDRTPLPPPAPADTGTSSQPAASTGAGL